MSRNDDEMLKAERRRMAAAFDEVLHEPVPDRLQALLAEPAAQVVDLGGARTQRRGMASWAAWGGMAATLVLGTLIGTRLAPAGLDAHGNLIATGEIETALNRYLAHYSPGEVAVQISFKDKGGRYCRTFSTYESAGLACRQPSGTWSIRHVAALPPSAHVMQQAASSLPPSVLTAVDDTIVGEALNGTQEAAARDAGWR